MAEKIFCACCGAELTNENSREVDENISTTGLSPYCLDCEERSYQTIAHANGIHLGLYLTCNKFDVPCEPLIIGDVNSEFSQNEFEFADSRWHWYIKELQDKDLFRTETHIRTFEDGVVNLLKIFGKNFTERDFGQYCRYEIERIGRLEGTREQREMWGTSDIYKGLPASTDIYNRLDKKFNQRVSEFRGQTLSPQQRDAIIKVSKWEVVMDHLLGQGEVDIAQKVQKMIQTELESEQMRKKDEKPVEGLQLDAWVEALEHAGLMEDGQLLTYDELLKELAKVAHSPKYDYSLDVGDQIILAIVNTMRQNSDMEILAGLPEEYAIEDEYGEFAPEETEQERKVKKFAGLAPKTPIIPKGKGKK